MKKRKLPVGIQSFADLRTNDYIYVDKTEYIWDLVENGKVYFLSRPRRFGKSLLVSTMEAYFLGKKELFKDLAIEELESSRGEDAWTEYPLITFYLSGGEYHTENGLADRLDAGISSCIARYDLNGPYEVVGETLAVRFMNLIKRIYEKTGKQAVILVDEYDKPLLETMVINPEQEEKNRQLYKGFFGVLKDMDQYLKFVFFTGVTKFSKVSIFSDLNQLEDISLWDRTAGICGITEQELCENFRSEIRELAETQGITEEDCLAELKNMYDGYHFSQTGPGMYNPFSLLQAFKQQNLSSFWFESGTPTFLVNKLEHSNLLLENLVDGVEREETVLRSYRPESADPVPLFYQSGYLTISGFDREFRLYSLRFPNREVQYGFMNFLKEDVLGSVDAENPVALKKMVTDLRNGETDAFMTRIQSLFAGIPYPEGQQPDYEREWRNQIYLILKLMGQNVTCEVHSARGRADCVAETDRYVYVMEFKLDETADGALDQINEKGYAEPYKADPRTILKVGANFSTEKRNITEWKTELQS